jgi:valyl-tRNA synthetase
MDISTKYDPSKTEDKWYKYWLENNFFSSKPDNREPYTIVIPPPNVTGVLHMGHVLNNTIQDILIRRARMMGKNALWVPGTDHASIATEARVVAKLKNEGIEKSSLSREEFLKHAWEWTEKHGGIILEQLKKLGCSCDWNRTKFTMDDDMSESVVKVFVKLFNKGLIYRGIRMINWDPVAKTAVSDEEVIFKEVKSKLYYVKYKISGENDYLTIATTRPETILGDTAVCVNPNDKRYSHLVGKNVVVPIVNRIVPIIKDEYVDMEFGTGCLKITPAHDINDYQIGLKYNLEIIDIFNDDGTLNNKALAFIGMDRFEAREAVYKALKEQGLIEKVEDYINKVGFSERTDAVIEPKLSLQWFMKMKEIAKPALENVLNGNIRLIPSRAKNIYKHWMENIKDWCISRQLWWGHRIPAFYLPDGKQFVVAENIEHALELAKIKTGNTELTINDLKQDEDVLDTWFSSWLWPISVFDGIRNPENEDIKYYYPTNDLITAPDILFFWVARMIMAGYEFLNEKPFSNVYLTGIVRDKLKRKMSKSLGNSPEPLELIEHFGADGVRMGMLLCSPAGNDLLYDDSLPEQGRNFANKIWNAFRLVKSWKPDNLTPQSETELIAQKWFESKLNQAIEIINDHFNKFRISDALMVVYKLFWDDFASWYLELIKPQSSKHLNEKTYNAAITFFEALLKILHPFMPFITEEIWQNLKERNSRETIMYEKWPSENKYNLDIINQFEEIKLLISEIRNIRQEKNIGMKTPLTLYIKHSNVDENYKTYYPVICKLVNINEIQLLKEQKLTNTSSFRINTNEFYIPLGDLIDKEDEIIKIKEELEYYKGFLTIVTNKLNNEKFVKNAPINVVETEKRKKSDAETKIKVLEDRLHQLNK